MHIEHDSYNRQKQTPAGSSSRFHIFGNEEIYNIFDTEKFLKRPALVSISNTSGLAGIAHWINSYYRLPQERHLDKNSELVHKLKDWVDEQYDEGRVTVLTDNELVVKITECCQELGIIL